MSATDDMPVPNGRHAESEGSTRVGIGRSVPVWRPPADTPPGQDGGVDAVLTALGKRFAALARSVLGYAVLAFLWIVIAGGLNWFSGLLLALAVLQLYYMAVFHARIGRWLAAGIALLATEIPKRVRVEVVTWKGSTAVLSVDGGTLHLDVQGASWAIRQMIARAGEVWLTGPDANGWAVVFVDALPVPLPAKVRTTVPARRQEPQVAGDRLPLWTASRMRLGATVGILFVTGLFVLMSATMLTVVETASPAMVFFVVAMAVLVLILLIRKSMPTLRLRTMLKTGEWTAYPVLVESWQPKVLGRGDAKLQMWLPGGTQLTVTLKQVGPDLLSNISASGTLWVVGAPYANATKAVGVPGYPIVALARFEFIPSWGHGVPMTTRT